MSELARRGVFHVDKLDFLWIYQRVRLKALSKGNIKAGFEATGLILFYSDRVLSNLTVIRTSSPSGTASGIPASWAAETRRTTCQLEQQARLIQRRLQRQSQSPTSVAIAQLVKGCQLAMNSTTILAEENSKLRATNDRQRRKRPIRRQFIALGGVLQAEEGQKLVAEAEIVVQQADQEVTALTRRRVPPTCSKRRVQGNNRTQRRQT